MENGGLALIGVGEGRGENKIQTAVEQAISNPLLEGGTVDGARRLLITLWVSESVAFADAQEAIQSISGKASNDPMIIFGAIVEEGEEDRIKVTVVATDFDRTKEKREEATFRVVKSQEVKRAVPEEGIQPVEPEEMPAYLRRKRKI